MAEIVRELGGAKAASEVDVVTTETLILGLTPDTILPQKE